ncbi:hypothetical protein SCHPADRAFT_903846 [Schizopora paradoxa]|uniref:Uncharacterized protein n=1 Tax=Schizopora paradoxa TaxID=27342 RepID=A0A0H2RWE9_9AGAM|nr:hypothetical protein SCHPADRAFT_903846 [Schizopora paradoxa]
MIHTALKSPLQVVHPTLLVMILRVLGPELEALSSQQQGCGLSTHVIRIGATALVEIPSYAGMERVASRCVLVWLSSSSSSAWLPQRRRSFVDFLTSSGKF